jgi:hypothetical protein
MFVGLNGIVVKSHGGSDAVGMARAIDVAASLVRYDVIAHMHADIASFGVATATSYATPYAEEATHDSTPSEADALERFRFNRVLGEQG